MIEKIPSFNRMNRKQIIAISCIVLLLGVGGVAVAQTGIIIEDFEDGTTGIFAGEGTIISEDTLEGNYSFHQPPSDWNTFTSDSFGPWNETVSFYFRIDSGLDGSLEYNRIHLEDASDTRKFMIQFEANGGVYDGDGIGDSGTRLFNWTHGTPYYIDFDLNANSLRVVDLSNGSIRYEGPATNMSNVDIERIQFVHSGPSSFTFDYLRHGELAGPGDPLLRGDVSDSGANPIGNASVNVSQNNEGITNTTTNSSGIYTVLISPGEYNVSVSHDDYLSQTKPINVTGNATNVLDFILDSKSGLFEFRTSSWMKHSSQQPYSAFYHGGDSPYRQGVTANTTATSGNTSVITVDNDTNSLISTDNVNVTQRVDITATYTRDGETYTETQTITVANRTIDNIEIMPNEQWVPTVLGFGEGGTAFGLGSEIQWLFVAIFTGASAAWMARNEWVGIGVIIACNLLFWPLGNVGLDIVLVSVFYGVFAGYQLNKIPSRSDTNVGGGLNEQQNNNGPPR